MNRAIQVCQNLVKRTFTPDSRIYRSLLRIKYYWRPGQKSIHQVLKEYSSLKKTIRFVQIGSNDGKTGDLLYEFVANGGWRGILVEPFDDLHEELIENYRGVVDNLIFEKAAIADEVGFRTIYRVKATRGNPDLPGYANQLGSFKKDVLLTQRKLYPSIEKYIVEESVPTLTFQALLDKHSFPVVDLIHIDTEGYDFELIKLIDLERVSPEIIIFEHSLLSRKDYVTCLGYLSGSGYKLYYDGPDTIAISRPCLGRVSASRTQNTDPLR